MTVKEAEKIKKDFYDIADPTEEDAFLYTEALGFLIHEKNDPHDMMELGGWYYGLKKFVLALKYYEMASAFDIDAADECLGYIWYYGRTGKRDFEKAYRHYSRSMERGNLVSTYKIADMYKNGYYVPKDCEKYKKIIESLYPIVKDARYLNDPLTEIFTRLAGIRKEQDRTEEAVSLYLDAKDFLAQRIRYNDFFGNLSIMKGLINNLYEILPFDPDDFDFYDLYYILKKPRKVTFYCQDHRFTVESLLSDGFNSVRFNDGSDDCWYSDLDVFFQKASYKNKRLTAAYYKFFGFEVNSDDGDH